MILNTQVLHFRNYCISISELISRSTNHGPTTGNGANSLLIGQATVAYGVGMAIRTHVPVARTAKIQSLFDFHPFFHADSNARVKLGGFAQQIFHRLFSFFRERFRRRHEFRHLAQQPSSLVGMIESGNDVLYAVQGTYSLQFIARFMTELLRYSCTLSSNFNQFKVY